MKKQTLGQAQAIILMIASCFGSGMLFLPGAFSGLGYGLGILTLFFLAIFTGISLYLLDYSSNECKKLRNKKRLAEKVKLSASEKVIISISDTDNSLNSTVSSNSAISSNSTPSLNEPQYLTYSDIGMEISIYLKYYIHACLIFSNFGTAVFFIKFGSEIITKLLIHHIPYFTSPPAEPTGLFSNFNTLYFYIVFLTGLISYTLLDRLTPEFLTKISFVNLASSIYYVLLMIGFGISSKNNVGDLSAFNTDNLIFPLVTMIFAIHCQFGFLSIMSNVNLEDNSPGYENRDRGLNYSNKTKKVLKIIFISLLSVFGIYVSVGFGGYKIFNESLGELNVVNYFMKFNDCKFAEENANAYLNVWSLNVIQQTLCLLFMVIFICGTPFLLDVAKENILDVLEPKDKKEEPEENFNSNASGDSNADENNETDGNIKVKEDIYSISKITKIILILSSCIIATLDFPNSVLMIIFAVLFTNPLSFTIPGIFGIYYGNSILVRFMGFFLIFLSILIGILCFKVK